KHTDGMRTAQVRSVRRPRSGPLARSESPAKQRVDGSSQADSRGIRFGGTRNQESALQRQTADQVGQQTGVDIDDLAAPDRGGDERPYGVDLGLRSCRQ